LLERLLGRYKKITGNWLY